jgi:hypothetical protein
VEEEDSEEEGDARITKNSNNNINRQSGDRSNSGINKDHRMVDMDTGQVYYT